MQKAKVQQMDAYFFDIWASGLEITGNGYYIWLSKLSDMYFVLGHRALVPASNLLHAAGASQRGFTYALWQ